MIRIKIGRRGSTHIPDFLREQGYEGEVKLTPDAFVIVMEKPGASSKDILKSLDVLRAHYQLLAEKEEEKEEEEEED